MTISELREHLKKNPPEPTELKPLNMADFTPEGLAAFEAAMRIEDPTLPRGSGGWSLTNPQPGSPLALRLAKDAAAKQPA